MDHCSAHPSGFLHSKISSLFPRFVPRTPRLCSCQTPSYTRRHSHPWAKAGSRSPRMTQMLFCPSQRPSNLHKSFSHQEASCRAAGWSTYRTNSTKKRVGSPFAHKAASHCTSNSAKKGEREIKAGCPRGLTAAPHFLTALLPVSTLSSSPLLRAAVSEPGTTADRNRFATSQAAQWRHGLPLLTGTALRSRTHLHRANHFGEPSQAISIPKLPVSGVGH